jgi:hypothetical protein
LNINLTKLSAEDTCLLIIKASKVIQQFLEIPFPVPKAILKMKVLVSKYNIQQPYYIYFAAGF